MSFIVEIEVAVEAFALGNLVERRPDARIDLEQVVPAESGLMPYFWIRGVDVDAVTDADEDDPALDEISVLVDTGDALLCRTVWDNEEPGLQQVIATERAALLEATGTVNGWTFQFRFTDESAASRFRNELREADISFEVLRVYSVRQMQGNQYDLTPEQREALTATHEAGFFETPRATSLADVADQLGISEQALSARYRRGLDTLLENTLYSTE